MARVVGVVVRMSKLQKVLAYLKTGQELTVAQSVDMFGYYRLSDGILKLKRRGFNITTELRTGKDTRYGVYRLEQ